MQPNRFAAKFEPRYEQLLRRFRLDDLDASHEWLTITYYLQLVRKDLVDDLIRRLGSKEGEQAPAYIAGQIATIDTILQCPKYLDSLSKEVPSRASEDPKNEEG